MATLADLLADPRARIEIVIHGQYLDENDDLQSIWLSRSGWSDPPGGPASAYCPPLVDLSLRVAQSVDPLEPGTLIDTTYSQIDLINDSILYPGYFDGWNKYSVDGLEWTIYLVGYLSTGERLDLVDVENDPYQVLVGVAIPEVSSSVCVVHARSFSEILATPLQPVTYSPPALYFPGTVSGSISLGNNLNITGDQSISVWIYLESIDTVQYIVYKDGGAQGGYYVAVGLVGGGNIVGGVEVGVRGQTPFSTTTAANVLRTYQWHRIDISIAATTRRIDIDGTTAITTSAITGTPASSSTTLTIGRSLKGRLHRLLYWSNARSNATMSAEGRVPIAGNESNLREAFLFAEGSGTTTTSIKSGSALSGTIGTGVLWDSASWHYDSILGQYEPYVLGTVPRAPITWIDPPKQIGQVSRGAIALLSELQSNHAAVSSANYTVNRSNSTITVTSGALSGTYSATVTANNSWNSALLFNGTTSTASALVTMPAASKYIGVHFRADLISATAKQLGGWLVGATSAFLLRLTNTTLTVIALNNAGTTFTASTTIVERKRYSVIGSLDTANPSTGLQLYLNGVLVATTPISGAWTGTQTTFEAGFRGGGASNYFTGVLDEIVIGNTAASLSIAQHYHAIPSTSSMTGILAGWHLDEATGTSASPFAGAVSMTMTLANVAWVAGRSAATDIARSVLYSYGYTESGEIDFDSWFTALIKNSADCGWFVSQGAKGLDILDVILGGLGFVLYLSGGLIKLKRFEGLSGVPTIEMDTESDIQLAPIDSVTNDPAIYQWTIVFATNNTKIDSANVAGSLASSDPDQYHYWSSANRSAIKSDGSILERFQGAESRSRTTALLNLIDAEAEAARLLALHRYGGDRKSIAVFAGVGGFEVLTEIGPLMSELELNGSDLLITGISLEEGEGTIEVWRPAI